MPRGQKPTTLSEPRTKKAKICHETQAYSRDGSAIALVKAGQAIGQAEVVDQPGPFLTATGVYIPDMVVQFSGKAMDTGTEAVSTPQ